MKRKRLTSLRPLALAAIGVFLGRGAQADTILNFDATPAGQPNNAAPGVLQTFGDYVTASSDGIAVVGFGTPNIGLSWEASGSGEARWDYYNDGGAVWTGAQLNDSFVGGSHSVIFTPNSAQARVVVKSFNFHPYYDSTERYTYNVSVLAGGTVVSGPTLITFKADATKNHLASINYTGAPGAALRLKLARVASTLGAGETEGGSYNIAVDDITFAQLPETVLRVGPQVVSVNPVDGQSSVVGLYSYQASITNGETALVPGSIQLLFDGNPVSPPPSVSTADGLTTVNYQAPGFLASGSAHTYTLIYGDNGTVPAIYTNQTYFTVANYQTLPAGYAVPAGAGVTRGFTCRTVAAATGGGTLEGSLARAKAQLDGTLIDPITSEPYPNNALPGPNPDGSFNIDAVINFDDDGTTAGNFTGDVTFPGLDLGHNNWFSTEALLYLDLAPGYYRFGVNSDDGFEVSAFPRQGVTGAPIVLGAYDANRGVADTLFDFLVTTAGVYPFRVIYFESSGDASCEFFSVNLTSGQKTLINDLAASSAVKSYRVLKPLITNIALEGSNALIQWAYGTPPFQLQFKSDLQSPQWNDSGPATTNRSLSIAVPTGGGFVRVAGQL